MANKRNALAELAEDLGNIDDGPSPESICKAQLIIAELAKVVDCQEPERIMPFDKPYDGIIIYAPYDDGLSESNSINEDEQRFILDLANAAWNSRAIAEEGVAGV